MSASRLTRALGGLLCAALFTACGDGGRTVTVQLDASGASGLDPYAPGVRLARVRVTVEGPERSESASLFLDRDARSAVFEGFVGAGPLEVRAEGFDELGNVVAFGRQSRIEGEGDVSARFPLRRNLAYVTHLPEPRQRSPESQLYVLDVATRGFVAKVALPEGPGGARPIGRGVSARGGAAMLVVFEAGGQGKLGILSAEDHSFRVIELPRPQELALGVPESPLGVAVGGGAVTFVDLDAGQVVERFALPVGGRVLDGAIGASGERALVVVDVSPGTLLIDLVRREVRALDVLGAPSGVALARDGRTAYVTSSSEGAVAEVDLDSGRTRLLRGFVRPVRLAAFADELPGILAVDSSARPRVVGYSPLADEALGVNDAVPTLPEVSGIAADGSGRRLVVVAAGTSTQTAGLTVLDCFAGQLPEGSSALYPTDPDDTYRQGAVFVARQRYRPASVGVIYGR
jgi:hypothetical protein